MQPYKEHPTAEYRSYLDLPKRQYFADLKKYPEPEDLRSTFGWFEVRRMPVGRVKMAASATARKARSARSSATASR